MTKLGIIGCGNMGGAIIKGLAQKELGFEFYCYDVLSEKAEELSKAVGATTVDEIAALSSCEYFLLATKPQKFEELALTLKPNLPTNAKIISILAGTSSAKLESSLHCKKIARVMPNTPCLLGEGVSGVYFQNYQASEQELVSKIFSAVGTVIEVKSDDEIDKITALTASGPAYVFEFSRILIEKAVSFGFTKQAATLMIKQLVSGSALLMKQSEESPEELRVKVTSKGGTTEAALDFLKQQQFENMLQDAVESAFKRAQ